jgi:hypothetical protein
LAELEEDFVSSAGESSTSNPGSFSTPFSLIDELGVSDVSVGALEEGELFRNRLRKGVLGFSAIDVSELFILVSGLAAAGVVEADEEEFDRR